MRELGVGGAAEEAAQGPPDPGPAEADIAPWVEYRSGNGPVGGFSSGWAGEVGRHQWVVK
jgi:hypothetical protein